jgi:predicted transposase YbfD/YdcC
MFEAPANTVVDHFSTLTDPRVERRKLHKLIDITTIAICGAVCGADDWVAVAGFGRAKEQWLRTFLELPNGIPSHDTFTDVFAALDPEEFQVCFRNWIKGVAEITEGEIVAIDGKTLRRSHDKTSGKSAIHMVSAWANSNRLVLGQVKVDDKSNEITAIPQLLKVLDLKGSTVTIDAMGCQTKIAEMIIDQEADYVLPVKKNQPRLHGDISAIFAQLETDNVIDMPYDTHQTINKGHGRIEIRTCWTIASAHFQDHLRTFTAWKGLNTIAMVRRERRLADKIEVETGYYIASIESDAAQVLDATRSHWGVENKLHWVLDIAFREDESRTRKGNGAQNFATLRHIALNLLSREKTAKCGIKNKRLKAGWDEAYLLKVLSCMG